MATPSVGITRVGLSSIGQWSIKYSLLMNGTLKCNASVRKLILIISMVLIAATSVAAKDWRGILPMHSTRADVEALLGPPPPPPANRAYVLDKGRSIYFLDEGQIYIDFADGNECMANVPVGTVLYIEITPKKDLPLSRLNIDLKNFKNFDASTPGGQGYEGFISTQEGFVVRVFKQNVEKMVYFASDLDSKQCPGYSDYFERVVNIMPLPACGLDNDYGDISWSDEKARLDNFAIQLLNDEKLSVGFIIAYAGQRATVGEARLRANRARNYLINVRHLNPGRVKAIDGGYLVDLTVYLYIVPPDAEPPPLMPMLDPSQVKIVTAKKQRKRK